MTEGSHTHAWLREAFTARAEGWDAKFEGDGPAFRTAVAEPRPVRRIFEDQGLRLDLRSLADNADRYLAVAVRT